MRALLIVLDSVGIGGAPDAADFGDDLIGELGLCNTAYVIGPEYVVGETRFRRCNGGATGIGAGIGSGSAAG